MKIAATKRCGYLWNYLSILNFFLNFSTRPPVSTSFCLPVKKGWHFEQISTKMFSFVEPVSITLPQAHLITVCLYSGWIPSLTTFTSFRKNDYVKKIKHQFSECHYNIGFYKNQQFFFKTFKKLSGAQRFIKNA